MQSNKAEQYFIQTCDLIPTLTSGVLVAISQIKNQTLQEIAAVHHKSVVQVILRWQLQRGIVPIPGSSNPAHLKENLEVFDFELSPEQMAAIAALDCHEKHDWY